VSYLNSPRKGSPRGKKICVWTHLGLKKIRNGRQPPTKKMEDDLKKKNLTKNIEDEPLKKWKTT
jgi:hypothetical protein